MEKTKFKLLFTLLLFLLCGNTSFSQTMDTTVYKTVDSYPEFRYKNCKDSKTSLDLYLSETQRWPNDVDFEGKIYVLCIVEKDGSLSNFSILRGIDETFDKSSIEFVKSMPKWIPGQKDGKVVRTQMIIPVKWK